MEQPEQKVSNTGKDRQPKAHCAEPSISGKQQRQRANPEKDTVEPHRLGTGHTIPFHIGRLLIVNETVHRRDIPFGRLGSCPLVHALGQQILPLGL